MRGQSGRSEDGKLILHGKLSGNCLHLSNSLSATGWVFLVVFFLFLFFVSSTFQLTATARRASLANGQQTMPGPVPRPRPWPSWSNKPHSRPDHVVQTVGARSAKESRLTSSGTKGAWKEFIVRRVVSVTLSVIKREETEPYRTTQNPTSPRTSLLRKGRGQGNWGTS